MLKKQQRTHTNGNSWIRWLGCVGSTDATQVGMEKAQLYGIASINSGAKLNMPSRTYNMTMNHRLQIVNTTRGHPARWNDMTLVLFDLFAMGVYDGKFLSDVELDLLERDDNDENRTSARYRGVWLMVDNVIFVGQQLLRR
jgi:hypothetical protein